jgi:GNAT superfamily N-acetyltransferase
MIIRLRRQDDIAACVQLLALVHAADGYPTRWPADPSTWLTPRNLIAAWVAEEERASLGHVALRRIEGDAGATVWSAACGLPPEQIAEVSRLFVAPGARGRGLGAALLEAARAEARRRGPRAALKVLEHDQAAITLYERVGWRRIASTRMPWTVADEAEALLHYYIAPD